MILENPTLCYLQKEEKTCAFRSISSIIHYLGYETEALHLQEFKQLFYCEIFHTKPNKVMQSIAGHIGSSKNMKKFNRNHKCVSLKKSFDVHNYQFDQGEFVFASLWAADADIGHAVCICDN